MRANKQSFIDRTDHVARAAAACACGGRAAISLATAADAAGFGRGGGGGKFSVGNGGNRGSASVINPGGKKLDWKKPSLGSSNGGRGAVTGDSNPGSRDRPHGRARPNGRSSGSSSARRRSSAPSPHRSSAPAKPAALSVANRGGSSPSGQQARRSASGMPPAGERRYVPDEVVIQLVVEPGAADHRCAGAAASARPDRVAHAGDRLHALRWKIPDRRSVPEVIRALEADRLVENVQPNYVHTTQEQRTQEQPGASGEPLPSEQAAPKVHGNMRPTSSGCRRRSARQGRQGADRGDRFRRSIPPIPSSPAWW